HQPAKAVTGTAIDEPKPQNRKKGDQTQRRRHETGKCRDAERQQRKVQPCAEPQAEETAPRIAALALTSRLVFDHQRVESLCDLQQEAVDVGIRTGIDHDFSSGEGADAPETREVETSRLVERPVGETIRE